jgi:hypothetical protein
MVFYQGEKLDPRVFYRGKKLDPRVFYRGEELDPRVFYQGEKLDSKVFYRGEKYVPRWHIPRVSFQGYYPKYPMPEFLVPKGTLRGPLQICHIPKCKVTCPGNYPPDSLPKKLGRVLEGYPGDYLPDFLPKKLGRVLEGYLGYLTTHLS